MVLGVKSKHGNAAQLPTKQDLTVAKHRSLWEVLIGKKRRVRDTRRAKAEATSTEVEPTVLRQPFLLRKHHGWCMVGGRRVPFDLEAHRRRQLQRKDKGLPTLPELGHNGRRRTKAEKFISSAYYPGGYHQKKAKSSKR